MCFNSALSFVNPSVGFIISSSNVLLTSIAILITIEYISELKIRHTELRDLINGITHLSQKILIQSMIDRIIDDKEANKNKKVI